MKKFYNLIGLLCLIKLYSASSIFNACDNDAWDSYKDEKCIRVLDNLLTHDDARILCSQEFNGAHLLQIDSAEEQEFLSNLIFETYNKVDNVHLGATRSKDGVTFQWDNETHLDYTNWAEEFPSSDLEKNCSQLNSHLSSPGHIAQDGLWSDVSCAKRNLVACQKFQVWTINEVQRALFQVRNELKEIRAHEENLEISYENLEANFTNLEIAHQNLKNQFDALIDPTEDPQSIKNCQQIQNPPTHPKALSTKFVPRNKVHAIYPLDQPLNVLCDFETDGGGWTVIQRRESGPLAEFYLNWLDYENGFGTPDKNYWIGLKALHALTADPTSAQELRIDLGDWQGNHAFAKYGKFLVGNSSDSYRLELGDYFGDAGDSLKVHNGQKFSTKDKDEDAHGGNCAEMWHGGWWYAGCGTSNLNGYYFWDEHTPEYDGIRWNHWKGTQYSLRSVEMKIRVKV